MDLIKVAENQLAPKKEYPDFKAGDTVTVHYKIIEGNKERIQQYRGVVLQRRGAGLSETFTVRKMSGNIGVERIFPLVSPFIDKIELNKHGRVRRAKIFYLRGLTGKKARIQEKRMKLINDLATPEKQPEKPEQVNQQEQA
jgi:large subunit ribosomal protein L19